MKMIVFYGVLSVLIFACNNPQISNEYLNSNGMNQKMKISKTGKQISVVPEGYNTVNPWIIVKGANSLVKFLDTVFDGKEDEYTRYYDEDSLIIHTEVTIENTVIKIFDSKPDWPKTPSFLQVYVEDMEETLKRAEGLGAEIITKPSEFVFGERLARFLDPWGNLWWINERMEEVDWEEEVKRLEEAKNDTSENYIRKTLLNVMRKMK